VLLELLKHLITVHLRHHDVEQNQVKLAPIQGGQRKDPILRLFDIVDPQALQPTHKQVAILHDVVDHENGSSLHAHSSVRGSMSLIDIIPRPRLKQQIHSRKERTKVEPTLEQSKTCSPSSSPTSLKAATPRTELPLPSRRGENVPIPSWRLTTP